HILPPPTTSLFPTRRSSDLETPAALPISEGDTPTDIIALHCLAVAGEYELAAVHDRKTVRQFPGKVEVLFDEQDRDIAAVAQVADRKSTRLNSSHVKISYAG